MDSDWMNDLTKRLVKLGVRVVRFEFPYMAQRRESGSKRPPNSKKILIETWRDVIAQESKKSQPLFIGGKSMGGRIASLIADEEDVRGFIGLGFPFHAPGKEPGDRIDHLKKTQKNALIIQGTRDSMGNQQECLDYKIDKKVSFLWLEDGDHSWKPRVKSGLTLEQHMDKAAASIVQFMQDN